MNWNLKGPSAACSDQLCTDMCSKRPIRVHLIHNFIDVFSLQVLLSRN